MVSSLRYHSVNSSVRENHKTDTKQLTQRSSNGRLCQGGRIVGYAPNRIILLPTILYDDVRFARFVQQKPSKIILIGICRQGMTRDYENRNVSLEHVRR